MKLERKEKWGKRREPEKMACEAQKL